MLLVVLVGMFAMFVYLNVLLVVRGLTYIFRAVRRTVQKIETKQREVI